MAPPADAADAADADVADDVAALSLGSLPTPLAHAVLLLLPLHARLLCRAVCRRWRALASAPELYRDVCMTRGAGGVPPAVASEALLATAAAAAAGGMVSLDVRGCRAISFDALLAAVAVNAGAVCAVWAGARRDTAFAELADAYSEAEAEALLAAGGARLTRLSLRTLSAGGVAGARRVLRAEPPFGRFTTPDGPPAPRLHLRCLHVPAGGARDAELVALAADARACAHVQQLYLCPAAFTSDESLAALVDAFATNRSLTGAHFAHCRFEGASPLRALGRLAGCGLSRLTLSRCEPPAGAFADAADVAGFAEALRAATRLTGLNLRTFFANGEGAAPAVLSALTGHPSLRKLDASARRGAPGLGDALGALVAADAPALRSLTASHCRLGDEGLRPLVEALRANRNLTELRCAGNALSAAFARDVLLPAVRANGSLRLLEAGGAARAAEAHVAARAAAARARGEAEEVG